jgi:serine/threonine protein kinase
MLSSNSEYYKSSGGKIPLRWTAPEALFFRRFSHASDAWSLGCILHEIYNDGTTPYVGMKNKEILDFLDEGKRLEPPGFCPAPVYALMIRLWHPEPEARASSSEAAGVLESCLAAGNGVTLCGREAVKLQTTYCISSAAMGEENIYNMPLRAAVGLVDDEDEEEDVYAAYCYGFGDGRLAPRPLTRTAGKQEHDWHFSDISRRRAEYVLSRQLPRLAEAARDLGMFLVRDKEKSQTYVLSILSNNKFWHHLLKQTASGMWYLNETLLPVQETLSGVVGYLGVRRPEGSWSTPLVNPASRSKAEQKRQLGSGDSTADV